MNSKKLRVLLVWVVILPIRLLYSDTNDLSSMKKVYELYSWQDKNMGWNFSIFSAERNSLIPFTVVTDPRNSIHGIKELKKKLLTFQPGTEILWSGRSKGLIDGDKNGEIKYPSKEIVLEISDFANTNNLKIVHWMVSVK